MSQRLISDNASWGPAQRRLRRDKGTAGPAGVSPRGRPPAPGALLADGDAAPQVRPAKKTAVPRLREYLGKHEPVRREYDELEFRCACGFDEATAEDREAYAQANGESIRRIIDLALGAGDRRDL